MLSILSKSACFLLIASAIQAEPSRGEVIYSQLCFTCHGAHLEGGIGPALADDYWHHGDSPEAILNVITKGVDASEMLAYEDVYPAEDLESLRDFILSHQRGMRGLVRSLYPAEFFKGQRFSLDQLKNGESNSQTPIPENLIHIPNNNEDVVYASANLIIQEPGEYHYQMRLIGRTSVFVNGEEVVYQDEKEPKDSYLQKKIHLDAGTHRVEFLHEEKRTHSAKFHGQLVYPNGDRQNITGRSLQGNVPKLITPGPFARVIRKWIANLSPRTLLCLLPNGVIVAFNPNSGEVEAAWSEAHVNQTPSLPDRSARPSEVVGTAIESPPQPASTPGSNQMISYSVKGDKVILVLRTGAEERTLTIAPDGAANYKFR